MKRAARKTLKWASLVLCSIMALGVLQVTALAYPEPWFAHSLQIDNFSFYSDEELNPDLQDVLKDVKLRLKEVEIYDPEINEDVFICRSQTSFNTFARLTLVPTTVPGFNLSLFHNSFVSVPRIQQRRELNSSFPKYSAIRGVLSQSIAHEVMHDYMVNALGFFTNRRLPAWKTEGYAEYGSNLVYLRADSVDTLSRRILSIQSGDRNQRAREYYTWGLVVEYLSEKQGYRFADIMHDSVTFDVAYSKMMAWHNRQSTGR